MDRLQYLKERLANLQLLKAQEEASFSRSPTYIADLNLSINSCEAQIRQLTFSREYPLVMVNGASV